MWNHINANTGAQYVCLSTDEKHTDVPNGSVLIEMNTSTFYLFDEEKGVWEPQAFGGGGMNAPDAEIKAGSVIIKSSTPGSTKRFKITVADDGVIKATEIRVEDKPG